MGEKQMGIKAFFEKFLLRKFYMAVTIFIAVVLQNDFDLMAELCGPLVQLTVCVTLPCASFLKLKGADMGPLQKALLGLCILAAVCYSIGGTVNVIWKQSQFLS